jgi:hypothetical protein
MQTTTLSARAWLELYEIWGQNIDFPFCQNIFEDPKMNCASVQPQRICSKSPAHNQTTPTESQGSGAVDSL